MKIFEAFSSIKQLITHLFLFLCVVYSIFPTSVYANDYGDAPASYGSASHTINNNIYLGDTPPDSEASAQFSHNARGDGADEDGAPRQPVSDYIPLFPLLKVTDKSYSVDIKVTNTTGIPALLFAWIDFDKSGTFEGNETTFTTVPTGVSGTSVTLKWFIIPNDIQVGTTAIRLRLTLPSGIKPPGPTGSLGDGEVEDFPIAIAMDIPPNSAQVSVINNVTPAACETVIFNDNFDDISAGTPLGQHNPNTGPVRDWTSTGGGEDTYAYVINTSGSNNAMYLGNGAVREIHPSVGAGFNFDSNGKLIDVIDAIALRDDMDDRSPSLSTADSGGESDWGPEPVKLSRTFTTTPGDIYRVYFTAIPEQGAYEPGIMRIDTPVGSVHFKAPGGSESEINYAIEFTATSNNSTVSFVNYGHVGPSNSSWCDPNSVYNDNAWCTVGASTDSKQANELIIDDVTVTNANCVATPSCLDTSVSASKLENYSGSVSGQPAGSYHPNAHNFRIDSSLFAAGFCAEKSDSDPQVGDEYSAQSTDRQGHSASTLDYLARLFTGLSDTDITGPIETAFPGDSQRTLDDLFQYVTWYYTDWSQNYADVQDMIDNRATSNGYSAAQKTAVENAATLLVNRSKGINGESQYTASQIYWLYNETSTGRQDILVPSSYVYGSNCPAPSSATISGTVFTDDNTNDLHDAPETGLQNINVKLYKDVNNDGNVDAGDTLERSADSDSNGNYSFTGVSDGDYLIQVDSSDSDLPSGLILGGINPLSITLSGSHISDGDFPFDINNSATEYCPASTLETGYTDYRIAWAYNEPLNTLLPDHTVNPNKQFDETVIASAPAQTIGSGLSSTFDGDKLTVNHLSSVDQSDMSSAYASNDYIEYEFTTTATMNPAQLFNGIGFNRHPYTTPYKINILFSEDDFASSLTILSDLTITSSTTGADEFTSIPTDKPLYLKPDTTYKFRVVFHSATNPNAVYWDDFHVSMGLCQDFSDAPEATYGNAIHDLPLGSTLILGSAQVDAESATRDGGDAGAGADGDDSGGLTPDDDDGVDIDSLTFTQGQTTTITATVSGTGGYLQSWIDWNGDGDFSDSGELIASDLQDDGSGADTGAADGAINFAVAVPTATTTSPTYIRFRWSTQSGLTPSSTAPDGETEDYTLTIAGTELCAIDKLESSDYIGLSTAKNSLHLSDDTLIYKTAFAKSNWKGNLFAYDLKTSDGSGEVKSQEWDAASQIRRSGRSLFSYDPFKTNSRGISFAWENLNEDQRQTLQSASSPGTRQDDDDDNDDGQGSSFGEKLVAWVAGSDADEGTGGLFRTRTHLLGDIVHSNISFNSKVNNYGYKQLPGSEGSSYAGFLSGKLSQQEALFVGSNGGMLHAFNASDGEELFAYVPNAVFADLLTVSNPLYGCDEAGCLPHEYLVDGQSSLGDAYFDSSWHTVLLGTLGLGGKALFALDVTDPDNFDSSDVLWEISASQAPDNSAVYAEHLGNTQAVASVIRLNNGQWAAVFANGYGSESQQAVLFLVDIQSGQLIKSMHTLAGSTDMPNGLSTPSAVDTDADYIADRIYAGDLQGNVWVFDISSANPDEWEVEYGTSEQPQPLFTACDDTNCSNRQPITAPPQVGRHPGGGLMVYVGTGKYFDVADSYYTGSPLTNSFYGLRDHNGVISAKSALQQQSILAEVVVTDSDLNTRVTSNNTLDYGTQSGWYMDLLKPPSDTAEGERVVSQALLRGGRIIFTTMIPEANSCSWDGSSWLMELNALDGKRLTSIPFDLNDDQAFNNDDKVTYNEEKTIVSAVQDTTMGIVASTPTIITHSTQSEGKYLADSKGNVGMFRESSATATGRMSWRKIR